MIEEMRSLPNLVRQTLECHDAVRRIAEPAPGWLGVTFGTQ